MPDNDNKKNQRDDKQQKKQPMSQPQKQDRDANKKGEIGNDNDLDKPESEEGAEDQEVTARNPRITDDDSEVE